MTVGAVRESRQDRTKAQIGLFAAVLIVIGFVSWCVGVKVDLESTIGEVGVAVGTLALAFFTWLLALQTKAEVLHSRRELNLTQKSLNLTRESIEANERPFVIPSGFQDSGTIWFRYSTRSGWWFLRIGLWNLGKGPAIVSDVQLRFNDHRQILLPLRAEIPISHMGPSRADRSLPLSPKYSIIKDGRPDIDLSASNCSLHISYRAASGKPFLTTASVAIAEKRLLCSGFARTAPATSAARPLLVPKD